MAENRIPGASVDLPREPVQRIVGPIDRFMRLGIAPGLLLIACAVIALVWANSGWADAYNDLFFGTKLIAGTSDGTLNKPLVLWINDGLMAIFFLLVGLEMKREILVGELSSVRQAALPVAAAIGGMLVPAGIYAAMQWGQPGITGWGIPMATDIAFALGALALVGSRVPASLRVFLVSLAVVDDLGALIVIALFYTESLKMNMLAGAGVTLVVIGALNLLRVRSLVPYLLLGVVLWVFVLKSGIHATIAGVALAMLIPATGRVNLPAFLTSSRGLLDSVEEWKDHPTAERAGNRTRGAILTIRRNCDLALPPLHRLEYTLHDWVLFLVMPIFALANAGVVIAFGAGAGADGEATGSGLGVLLAVSAGLIIGKPVGIFLMSFIAVKLGWASLPAGVTWRHIIGVGALAGIGFTMALFIGSLAFTDDEAMLNQAKLGILGASVVSGVIGLALLWTSRRAD